VRAQPEAWCEEVRSRTVRGPENCDQVWFDHWVLAESEAQKAIDQWCAGHEEATEPGIARCLPDAVSSDTTFVVSSSMPIRDFEWYAPPLSMRVLANRGANGIDGVVSTALGVALASGGPTVALVGDLAFLHDVSALVTVAGFSAALTVVVADNAGGGIFNFLPPATGLDPGTFETLFGTPQAAGVEAVAAGFGWPVEVAGPERSLEEALDRALGGGSLGVIRVPLPDRAENVAIHARLNAEVAAAVDADAH
jgi:2-succinyl-5-enolpyruvyl-6-hydroxy-3-cyclohexene-1-carboxylate synthase